MPSRSPSRSPVQKSYEIDWHAPHAGRLRAIHGLPPREARRLVGRACWEALEGRTSPCPGCPVFAPGGPRAGVLAEDDGFRVVHAARTNGAATIDVFRMDQDLVTQLIQEKLRRLAARAQLSPRERLVLHLSCEGKGIKEIAQAAAISQRTARFHVTNLLRKLGAGSRQEVLPLLLRPLPSPRARVARRRRP